MPAAVPIRAAVRPFRLAALAFAAGVVLAAPSAEAALSPYYQRLVELRAILADGAITGALEAHGPIEAIEAAGPDRYILKAGGCSLAVTVTTVPPPPGEVPMPGPRKFRLTAGEVACP